MSELDFLDEGSIISSPSSETISLVDHLTSAMAFPPSLVDEHYTPISNASPKSKKLWHELNSIIPLLKLLPALKEVNGYYVLNGEAKEEDITRIKSSAGKVKKFTSINESLDISSPIIAPSAYFQLFQLLGGPFSSIRELHLLSSSSVLQYISMLLSASLHCIEMDIISSADAHNLEPFLNMLPFKAPSLTSLVLRGPKKLSNASLEFISKCTNIQSLELSAVVGIKDWNLLQSIGTLPSLEELTVITHDLEYRDDVDILASSGFHSLQKLTITAPFLLIRDLVWCIGSTDVQSVFIAPVVDLAVLFTPHKTLPATPEPHPIALAPSTSDSSSNHITCLRCGRQNERTSTRCLQCSHILKKKKKTVISSPAKPAQENITIQEHAAPPVKITAPVDDFNPKGWLTLLQQAFEVLALRWGDSLKSFTLSLQDTSEPTLLPNASHILEIPPELIQLWANFCNLRMLDIRFWKLALLDDAIIQLACSRRQLQSLRLPLEPYGNPIHLSTLYPLTRRCPDLDIIQASINCNIENDEIPTLDSPPDYASTLKHKLSTLSLGSVVAPKQPLIIARYINTLFPYLDTLETHEGLNEQHWKQIFEVAQLCQSVREDDRKRFSN